jgi:uncharacterized protein (DUF983 family)
MAKKKAKKCQRKHRMVPLVEALAKEMHRRCPHCGLTLRQ